MKKLLLILPLVILLCFTFSCQQGEEVAEEVEKVQIETGYADVNKTRLYYEIAGSGDALVLIHGNFGDNRHWDGQFEALAKNYKVIRYDVRGYGKSSLPVEGESYSNHDDLKALLEHLGISNAHVCGLSMGSGIAVDFALVYPEMCESLIPTGPWAFGYNSPATAELFEVFGKISSVLKKNGTKAAANCWSDSPYFKSTFKNPKVLERFREISYDFSFWNFMNEDPVIYVEPPAAQQLGKLSLPTLIVTAEYDLEACREIADLMEQKNPNAKKIVIAGAGHCMNMEKPDEFNKAVLDFLKELE